MRYRYREPRFVTLGVRDMPNGVVDVVLDGPDDSTVTVLFRKGVAPEVLRHDQGPEFSADLAKEAVRIAAWSAQLYHCRTRKSPNFAPLYGVCHECGEDAVEGEEDSWAFGHVTGCRKCQKSYCD